MAKELEQHDIPAVSVGKACELLTEMFATVIEKGLAPKTLPSVMMWGPPGVGKSQAVRQIAGNLEKRLGKQVNVTDVRLLLFNPIDLRGIPTANADKTLAIWLKPQIFQMDPSDDVLNILFLDEISAAPQSVQAAAYQITLDRVVGEHKLPENCFVVAAGNRVTDRSVAFKMPKALANRLLHFEITHEFNSWLEWAVHAGINPKVTAFLGSHPEYLLEEEAAENRLAFATPRSWEMVSNVLNNVSNDENAMFLPICGLLGNALGVSFRNWCKVFNRMPSLDDIFSGKAVAIPKDVDLLHATVCSMVLYTKEHITDMPGIEMGLRYAKKFPPEFGALYLSMMNALGEDFRKSLQMTPEYLELAKACGEKMNGR